MASAFGIVEADITPRLIPTVEYAALLRNPETGVADVAIADVIEDAEAEFEAHCGGMFTTAANIALAKPIVLVYVAYHLHLRRTANPDYGIPDAIKRRVEACISWVESIGRKLLAAEGDAAADAAYDDQVETIEEGYTLGNTGVL